MATDSLPPIPTPRSQRWREFRIQVLPVIMFVSVLAMLSLMWRSFVQPAGIIGEVQPIRANIMSLTDGVLAELTVDLFDEVVKDQPIARVMLHGEEAADAALKSIEKEMKVLYERMKLDLTRNMGSHADLKMRLAEAKIALAAAQRQSHYANREFERVEKLFKENLITEGTIDANGTSYSTALRDRDMFAEEVAVRTRLVQDLEKDLAELQQSGKVSIQPTDKAIEEAIQAQQQVLRLTEGPQILRAPMDGRVSMILKRAGEKVVRGEPLVTISSPTSDRVIGYLRQPISVVPTTNDMVKVRTRSQKRLIADCKILHVGPSLEAINPALISPDVQRIETGLPILVALPAEFKLVPGEYVDLSIQYSKR
jgi:multidrug resistance efflux pump